MGMENFGKVKGFLTELVDKLALYSGQSTVGIVTFSGGPKVKRDLSEPTSRQDIIAAINALHYDGGYPFIADAMSMLHEKVFIKEKGDRPDASNYVILVTGKL